MSSRWVSRPRGLRFRSGCGKAARRTRPWRARCWPTSLTAAWIPGRRSCSSWTAAKRSDGRSRTCSASARWCIAVTGTRNATCSICSPAETRLTALAADLERSWPDAAASLREGLAETLTLMRLGITGRLARTLSSTNPIESMIEIVRHPQRNGNRWQDGDMRKRWTAAGMLGAEQQFRRIVGYSDLAKLVTAIERRHLSLESQNTPRRPEVRTDTVTTEDAAQLVTV